MVVLSNATKHPPPLCPVCRLSEICSAITKVAKEPSSNRELRLKAAVALTRSHGTASKWSGSASFNLQNTCCCAAKAKWSMQRQLQWCRVIALQAQMMTRCFVAKVIINWTSSQLFVVHLGEHRKLRLPFERNNSFSATMHDFRQRDGVKDGANNAWEARGGQNLEIRDGETRP